MTLLSSLIAYWKLDETSGSRLDSHNNKLHLTDVNGVSSALGKINDAADFVSASSQQLTHVDDSLLQTGNIDYTFSMWIKTDTVSGASGIISRWDSGHLEFLLGRSGTFLAWLVGDGVSSTTLLWSGTLVVDTWYHVIFGFDSAANDLFLRVNNAAKETIAATITPAVSNPLFRIGVETTAFPSPTYFDGLIDEIGFWKRLLTDTEEEKLYNNGNGLAYPFGIVPDVITTESIPLVIPSFVESDNITIIIEDPLFWNTRSLNLNLFNLIDSYNHNLRSIGGYWSAKLSIKEGQFDLEDWIENGLGRHVQTYNPSLDKIWEGFVNKVTVNFGNLTFSIGPFINIGNRISITYTTEDTSQSPPVTGIKISTSVVNNTDSQSLYGIIEKVISIGKADSTMAEKIRDTYLQENSNPETSRKSNLSGSSQPKISIDCLGYWHLLKLYTYTSTTTGTQNLTDKIKAVLQAEPNNIFSTNYSDLTENTFQVNQFDDKNRKAESILKELNTYGDSFDNKYNIGMYNDRKLKYEIAPSVIEYQQRISENLQITNNFGKIIESWNVEPGRWIFYPDFFVGRNIPVTTANLQTDPRAGYIESVKFTAPNKVSVNGEKFGELDQLMAKVGVKGVGS